MTRLLTVAVKPRPSGWPRSRPTTRRRRPSWKPSGGAWKGVSVVQDGKEMAKAEAGAVRLTVTGEKYALKMGYEDVEGTHRLDRRGSRSRLRR